MASQPTGIPILTCNRERTRTASDETDSEIHFEVNLRMTSPTAIGRRPPDFFFKAISEAPHK